MSSLCDQSNPKNTNAKLTAPNSTLLAPSNTDNFARVVDKARLLSSGSIAAGDKSAARGKRVESRARSREEPAAGPDKSRRGGICIPIGGESAGAPHCFPLGDELRTGRAT